MFITKWLNTTYHTFSHMLVHTGGARPWLEQAKWEPLTGLLGAPCEPRKPDSES